MKVLAAVLLLPLSACGLPDYGRLTDVERALGPPETWTRVGDLEVASWPVRLCGLLHPEDGVCVDHLAPTYRSVYTALSGEVVGWTLEPR